MIRECVDQYWESESLQREQMETVPPPTIEDVLTGMSVDEQRMLSGISVIRCADDCWLCGEFPSTLEETIKRLKFPSHRTAVTSIIRQLSDEVYFIGERDRSASGKVVKLIVSGECGRIRILTDRKESCTWRLSPAIIGRISQQLPNLF